MNINVNKPELIKMCLELIGYQNHKAKAAEIAQIRKMKPKDLKNKLIELEKEAKFFEENKCDACLEQQRIQSQINEKTYNKRLLANATRKLVCYYCQHSNLAIDGDETICAECGALQSPSVSYDKYH